jgi:hypothetical protein
MRTYTDQVYLLNAVAANGASTPQNFVSFRNVELEVAQTGFSGTIQFVGSNADAPPAFGSAASASNPWDYIATIDQKDGAQISGGTGIVSTTVTSVRNLEANTNAFKWIGVIITNFTAGSVTVKGKGVSGDA